MNVQPDFNLWFQLVWEFEGCKLEAYKDTGGVWTIGVGATYNHKKSRKVQQGDFITKDEALDFFRRDAQVIVAQLNQYIRKPLNSTQSTAIADYTYNRGIGNLLKTQLDELINANPNDSRIAAEIRGTGLKDRMGNLLKGLQRRRNCEAYLYEHGVVRLR